jgi:hypothetical protein
MSTKRYLISAPYYSLGHYYEAGTIITVPADRKPSVTWTLVEDDKPEAKAEKPAEQPKKSRPSDRDIA